MDVHVQRRNHLRQLRRPHISGVKLVRHAVLVIASIWALI